MNPPEILKVENVSLAAPIGLDNLLQDITFTIPRGDRVAIIGPSGAGKTSLLRLLNRLSEPSSGQLYFQQQPYSNIPVTQLRRKIVLTPQEPKLLGMRVQEALAYPLQLQKRPQNEIRDRVAAICELCQIPDEWLERNELQLSLGQRQLCAIARSLILDPPILLLDEPTSALDIGTAERIVQVLKSLTATTLMMVNHQLDMAAQLCDRVLYLESGQLQRDIPITPETWSELRSQLRASETAIAQEWDVK
ncbi:MAG: ATP-binding cassette domain-containing protein [Jaaginema sp. PMC 1079.18]|nr:ATP-binding cassette domain-containing protein [Jaaginema sp. PMC 1080.18]MEC4849683.1 ATP-binding cassette domain-containing protein [Jaaginema sp. PMC 1079.18]MEC4866166.1 ATP-binding cassette domain-containing protein [Jaaginema sp. PMC 1078.18]